MLKLLLLLLIATQVYCADDETQTFSDDEIDITTDKSDDKVVKAPVDEKELPKNIPKDKIDDKSSKTDEKFPDYDEKDTEPEITYELDPKSKDEKGVPDKGVEEKHIKKDDKPLEKDPNMDLGKDYKRVSIKDSDKGFGDKDTDKGVKFDGNGGDDKGYGGIPDDEEGSDGKHPLGKPTFGGEHDKFPEEGKGGGSGVKHHKEILNGNEIMDQLLGLLKRDYRSEFEKVKLNDPEPIKHGRWGTVLLKEGVITGLTNVNRVGDVLIVDEFGGKKLIVSDIAVNDIYVEYKVNAKLFHKISIKNKDLKIWLKKALLNVRLEVDRNAKKVIIKDLKLKSTQGFDVRSGRLFWPFNKLMNTILKNQQNIVKGLIEKEISQYMGKVVHNIQFEEVFAKF